MRARTDRALLIGFLIILFVVGLGLIGLFYGGGGLAGGLACLLAAMAVVGVLALVLAGLGKLSEWLDRD